jgi:ERF superfamily
VTVTEPTEPDKAQPSVKWMPVALDERPTVQEAVSLVMRDVQVIGKSQSYEEKGREQYKFRGIDDVLNAVGPVLREHGVIAMPYRSKLVSAERYETKSGTRMQNVIVKMQYQVIGPRGDSIWPEAMGQASDAGDKAIPKAQSVAYRDMLCELLCIPTGVTDPSSENHEAASTQAAQQDNPGTAVNNQIGEWQAALGWNREQVFDAYAKWNGGQLLSEANVAQRQKFVGQLAEHRLATPAPKTNVAPGTHVAGGPYPPADVVHLRGVIDGLSESIGWDAQQLAEAYARWNGGHALVNADGAGLQSFIKQLRDELMIKQQAAADKQAEAEAGASRPADTEPPF